MADVVISDEDCIIPNDPIEDIIAQEEEIPGKFQIKSNPY
jgi:hypothetical protein